MKFLCVVLLLMGSVIVNAADMDINVNSNEPTFSLQLPSNPTTGYQWSVSDYDKNLFSLQSSNYQKSTSNLVGAGGQMIFTFSLNQGKNYPEQTVMKFKYARPWEKTGGTATKATVHFGN